MIKLKYVIVLKVKEHIPFEGIHSYCFKLENLWKIQPWWMNRSHSKDSHPYCVSSFDPRAPDNPYPLIGKKHPVNRNMLTLFLSVNRSCDAFPIFAMASGGQ